MAVAVTSAGPYANHLHLASEREPRQYLTTRFFAGQMPFLLLNQERQSTEGQSTDGNECDALYKKTYALTMFTVAAVAHVCTIFLATLLVTIIYKSRTLIICLQKLDDYKQGHREFPL